eukprot:TRINITY_DN16737_c0_g2_i1.p1 TRINITY_DN16737_c0_g2~~TRINITY_DN16737_c0_g2_i1.p1  ORF type:complete len:208 (+),score=55.45 TRINITY_DN16737_c0_g2_i1:59-682(+)
MPPSGADGALALGRVVFDPVLIVTQIVVLQAVFYLLVGGAFFLFEGSLLPTTPSLSIVFNADLLDLHTVVGVVSVGVFTLAAVAMAWAFLAVVSRSKRCLDHAVTMYTVHTLLCTAAYHFPTTLDYWLLILTNASGLTLLSEYLCMKQELRDIPIQNPDERHGQQASLVRQKEQEMKEIRAGGAPRSGSPGAPAQQRRSASPKREEV